MKVSFAPRPSAEVCHLPLEEGDPHPLVKGSTGTAGKEQLFPANAVILRGLCRRDCFFQTHRESRARALDSP
jgi:hypothetical protein